MKRILAGLLLLMGVLVWHVPRAGALSCVSPEALIDKMTFVVEGTVLRATGKDAGDVTIAVTRYYRGSGPAVFLGKWKRWGTDPGPKVGMHVIMGFRQAEGGLMNDICGPYLYLTPGQVLRPELRAALGPGELPEGPARSIEDGAPAGMLAVLGWTVPGALVSVGLSVAVLELVRRLRRRRR